MDAEWPRAIASQGIPCQEASGIRPVTTPYKQSNRRRPQSIRLPTTEQKLRTQYRFAFLFWKDEADDFEGFAFFDRLDIPRLHACEGEEFQRLRREHR